MDEFIPYQIFINEGQANEVVEVLREHNIEFVFESTSENFDPTYTNTQLNKQYFVKLRKSDFEVVDGLLLNIASDQLDGIDKEHYLNSFSDQELIEVLVKSDEWSKMDYLLAQRILKERGQDVSEGFLKTLRSQRIADLAKPNESQKVLLLAGYVFAFLGGVLGFFIGWHLCYSKKTLPNGEKVLAHSVEDRKHGYRILILGIVFVPFWVIVRILIGS